MWRVCYQRGLPRLVFASVSCCLEILSTIMTSANWIFGTIHVGKHIEAIDSVGYVIFVERSSRHQETLAKNMVSPLDFTSSNLMQDNLVSHLGAYTSP